MGGVLIRYLLPRLHRPCILALMNTVGHPSLVRTGLIVHCPRYRMRYVADPEPGEEGIPLMEDERLAAVAWLDHECPDHGGWFEVGDASL